MDVFELLAQGRLGDLKSALATDPALALGRHTSGASLLAWAHYVGHPEAAALIRPYLVRLDPHDAIVAGEIEAVASALAGGWDGNARSADGFTPLALAAFFRRPAIFDLLLPLTRNINEQASNQQKVAAIHAATAMRDARMVEALLRAGAIADLPQADGFTPLHAASAQGDAPVAALLVLFGANPHVRNGKGKDAVEMARDAGHGWLADRLEGLHNT